MDEHTMLNIREAWFSRSCSSARMLKGHRSLCWSQGTLPIRGLPHIFHQHTDKREQDCALDPLDTKQFTFCLLAVRKQNVYIKGNIPNDTQG